MENDDGIKQKLFFPAGVTFDGKGDVEEYYDKIRTFLRDLPPKQRGRLFKQGLRGQAAKELGDAPDEVFASDDTMLQFFRGYYATSMTQRYEQQFRDCRFEEGTSMTFFALTLRTAYVNANPTLVNSQVEEELKCAFLARIPQATRARMFGFGQRSLMDLARSADQEKEVELKISMMQVPIPPPRMSLEPTTTPAITAFASYPGNDITLAMSYDKSKAQQGQNRTRTGESRPGATTGAGSATKKGTERQGAPSPTGSRSQSRDGRSYSRDRNTRPYSKDRNQETRSFSKDREGRTYSTDRTSRPYSKERPRESYSRDSDSRSTTRPYSKDRNERPWESYSRDRNSSSTNRSSESTARPYSRDRNGRPYSRDRTGRPYDRTRTESRDRSGGYGSGDRGRSRDRGDRQGLRGNTPNGNRFSSDKVCTHCSRVGHGVEDCIRHKAEVAEKSQKAMMEKFDAFSGLLKDMNKNMNGRRQANMVGAVDVEDEEEDEDPDLNA
jgi:hypothetical protein